MPSHARVKSLKHWSKNVRDVLIAHNSLHVRVEGGSENGEFLYVGGFTGERIKYKKGRLRVGDVLVELNDEPVVGLTLQDLMNRIQQTGKEVNFKVVQPGGGISKDICDFLTREFPSSSKIDVELQNVLRDNLYARTVPCTTRLPRAREEPGIDYIFVSKEKFEEMEENGDFLESGTYNGHYYGTLKPTLQVGYQGKASLTANQHQSSSLQRDGETSRTEPDVTGEDNNTNVTIRQETNALVKSEGDLVEVGDLGTTFQDSNEGTSEEDDSVQESGDQRQRDIANSGVAEEFSKELENYFNQI